MALSFPLAWPSVATARRVTIRARSTVGVSASPFTAEQQVYVNQGEVWALDVQLPPMKRAAAEDWIGFLVALNGMEGTFTAGQPGYTAPRGDWLGSPKVHGAHAAGVKSIAMDGFTAFATVKRGDWFQTGSGSSAHLHKIVQDGTADSGGELTLEVWPRTRAALADDATFTTTSPVGLWRLASNDREWDIDLAMIYGISFSAIEAL